MPKYFIHNIWEYSLFLKIEEWICSGYILFYQQSRMEKKSFITKNIYIPHKPINFLENLKNLLIILTRCLVSLDNFSQKLAFLSNLLRHYKGLPNFCDWNNLENSNKRQSFIMTFALSKSWLFLFSDLFLLIACLMRILVCGSFILASD